MRFGMICCMAVVAVLAGCMTYGERKEAAPINLAVLEPGQDVRVELASGENIDGTVSEYDQERDVLVLLVSTGDVPRTGVAPREAREIPRLDIVYIRGEELSMGRTMVATGVGTLTIILIMFAVTFTGITFAR